MDGRMDGWMDGWTDGLTDNSLIDLTDWCCRLGFNEEKYETAQCVPYTCITSLLYASQLTQQGRLNEIIQCRVNFK